MWPPPAENLFEIQRSLPTLTQYAEEQWLETLRKRRLQERNMWLPSARGSVVMGIDVAHHQAQGLVIARPGDKVTLTTVVTFS